MKKYIIFDMDGTLLKNNHDTLPIIFKHLQKHLPELDYNSLKYYSIQTGGAPLIEQLRVIFKNSLNKEKLQKITHEIYGLISEGSKNNSFFDGVADMIETLQKDYILFLSTGNSDDFAQKKLLEGGVSEYFDHIIGSSSILKGPEHIEIFKKLSGDANFEEYAIYVGDGNTDREIAQIHNIDFIKVGKSGMDKYEIDNVTDCVEIIQSL